MDNGNGNGNGNGLDTRGEARREIVGRIGAWRARQRALADLATHEEEIGERFAAARMDQRNACSDIVGRVQQLLPIADLPTHFGIDRWSIIVSPGHIDCEESEQTILTVDGAELFDGASRENHPFETKTDAEHFPALQALGSISSAEGQASIIDAVNDLIAEKSN